MAGLFYIFHGDDSHSQRATVNEVKSRLGDPSMVDLNTTNFIGRDLAFSALKHACSSIPFLAEKRLIIVEDLLLTDPTFLEELIDYLPQIPNTTRLIFIESELLSENHPAVRLAKNLEAGYVKSFTKPKGSGLEYWIRQRVADSDGKIAPQAVHLLAVNVGSNLDLLEQEIEKLILYKNGHTIEPDDVSLLCPYIAEASIFDLVDAISTRNGRIAARILNEKIFEGTNPEYLFAMFIRQFRLLIQSKELAAKGAKPAEIASKLEIHPYVAGKVQQQCHNFSQSQLEDIYSHLLDIDVAAKTGKTDLTTALTVLVAGVTG